MSVVLAATAAVLFGIGTYLILQRKLSRIIIGVGLFSHGANVLLITSGRPGLAPLIGVGDVEELADPLPQALALTAIVISFGVTALLLALAYRSWQLTNDDEVVDDVEDRAIATEGAGDAELADAETTAGPGGPAEIRDDADHDEVLSR
jgi:multicomponent Na+:H+ antiporter subunit C